MDSMSSTFLLFLLVTAAVELETVSSKRLALHKAKILFPSTEIAEEQVQRDSALAAGAQAHLAKDLAAGEAKSFFAEEQQADTAAEVEPQPADGPVAAQVHVHLQGPADEQDQPAGGAEAQSEEAHAEEQPQINDGYIQGYTDGYVHGRTDESDAIAQTQLDEPAAAQDDQQPAVDFETDEEAVDEYADAVAQTQLDETGAAQDDQQPAVDFEAAKEATAKAQPQLEEGYIQGYIHGYIHGRTDEYADAVAQTELDEAAAAQDDQQPAADSEAAEEAVAKVSDANTEKAHLDKARAALVAAQAPINSAQVAMAREAFFWADGRQQELAKAVEAMKKARMAATEREKERAAWVVAQAPIDDAAVAMAEEAPGADGMRQDVMTAMGALKRARMDANGAALQAVKKA